jgi:4-nitrophenyl phosphatase
MNQLLSSIDATILDGDGVLWLADQPLVDLNRLFINFSDRNIKFVLATNSATGTVDELLNKLQKMGARLEPWQIITSGMATGFLLKQKFPKGGPIHIMGSPALIDTLKDYGFYNSEDNPQAVVAGLDRKLSYEKIENTVSWIHKGLPFYGTNPDATYPTPRGLEPGAGACIAPVEIASGVKPTIAGKPSPYLFSAAMERLKSIPQKTLVIGDRLNTDILGGARAGCKTVLVLTGISREKDLVNWSPQPDKVIKNVMDLFPT